MNLCPFQSCLTFTQTSRKTHQIMEMKEDRISKLPDPILHQILSSINLKHAVQTSTLSKRWKHVWSSLPNLNFNYTTLHQIKRVSIVMRSLYDTNFMPRFTNFVTQFLSNRDHASTVSKLQLTSNETGTDSRFVEKCIEYAIRHGVQELDLDTYCSPTPIKFPVGLFTSRTLKVLKVKQYTNCLVVPKPFVLPNIKTLYLDSFNFKDGDDLYSFTKEPFSSFDNLEELTLHNCEIDGLIISCLKLRNLEISFQHMLFSREKKMESIITPRLRSFKYKGYVSLVCSVMDIPCLEEVYFDLFANLEPPYTDEIQKKMPPNLIRMLKQLGNAKFVTLTLHTIEVLAMDPDLLVQNSSPILFPFPNMKHLKLKRRRYGNDPMNKVPKNVINYLTKGSLHADSLLVQFPQGIN